MIEINHVTKRYGKEKTAVADAVWNVPDGKITGFIGPNGAGKTTTLKMITGVLKPDSGAILINNIDIVKSPLKAKEQFGYVSDTPDNFLRLKGIEYLNFMADIYNVPSDKRNEFIDAYSKRFGIEQSLGDKILSYSHGMRQKIMIMGALIHSPSVWILDEPMTGLDPQASYELKQMMKEHAASGKSVLFSTHVLEVAEKLCDNVVIIRKGEIKFMGTLDELKLQYPKDMGLEMIFLELTGDGKDN
ncbi:ABC transporter ATP-binding protein [Bariatricus massiliensis]|uniref:ABC transporter ATP-binding protein n=1 Tax=Bariatricus massiliensis TaxID=1745713 RepID=A0ABS8DL17_9FIRM|nr:ABC transporter ATP-binding protein [Bariatricus massiliensis]MCB7305909.1 ABC transporter ATP-binding protein [Bariatricus massiliensis]MCB7376501.1 ABC transporter ATP-binding protein [Bariatricus massiliensis]MCB7389052.1 ABC transporter ATP-binding protein [Bariatricus massiliensis]MCB7413225.1 ABC transporter ATP-binding protein [Bariatricus massiliensis]MCQ5255121.1 ABC transporter ATP-binding protein [Bariatricus massiliensis]